jgi:alpha-beta hydrolase superfamily lysophospholipase
MMQETIKKITTVDNQSIAVHIFSPTNDPFHQSKCSGVILAIHGFAEHIDRYRDLAKTTCMQNKTFVMFNLRGHGKDANKLGDVKNMQFFILDIIYVFNYIKNIFSHLSKEKFALFGHSFGGLLTTYASCILQNEVKSIFLSAPFFATKQKLPKWKVLLANNLSNLTPELMIPIDIDETNISFNKANIEAYKNDPHILRKISTRFGQIIANCTNEEDLKTTISNITAATTILLPTEDKLVDSQITLDMAKHFAQKPLIHEVPESGHEAFNEVEKVKNIAISYYEKWLEKI